MTDPTKNGNGSDGARTTAESFEIKVGLAEMMKGGVIMDVTNPDEAKIAENVNRWRRQLGLGEATGADLDALPQGEMLGQATLRFDETATDGSKRLVGHMLFAIDRSVFVRLSGSPDVVEDSIGAFESFVASLRDPAPAAVGICVGIQLAWRGNGRFRSPGRNCRRMVCCQSDHGF